MNGKTEICQSIFLNPAANWQNLCNFATHMTHLRTDILTRPWHWLLRFRKRCGYGIHSPFAFGFVTGVIYEKGEYYAYSSLPKPDHGIDCSFRLKDLRLMFRVMNYQRPAVCLCLGDKEAPAARLVVQYMQAGSLSTRMLPYEEWNRNTQVDMVFGMHGWAQHLEQLLPHLSAGGLVVVHDICSTRERRKAWSRLKESEQSTVSFNLRDFGIVFFRSEMQRQTYVVNYF